MALLQSIFVLKCINNSLFIKLREALFLSSRYFIFMAEERFSVNAEVVGTDKNKIRIIQKYRVHLRIIT